MLILETQVSQLKEMVLSLAAGKQPVQRREVDDEEQVYDALERTLAQRHATLRYCWMMQLKQRWLRGFR